MSAERAPIGIWWELPPGSRWTNEGVSRVVGFLIEGAASCQKYIFHLVVQSGLAAEVAADLRSLDATEGLDWVVHSPSPEQEIHYRQLAQSTPNRGETPTEVLTLALFANDCVPVEGWIITFPHFQGALWLKSSTGVLMPDAIPFDFPLGWSKEWGENGYWSKWRDDAHRVCAAADAVINFSDHVALRHSGPILGVPASKIRVVPLAPPDLSGELPFVEDRKQTACTRAFAAEILREHASLRGIDYLRGYPFEEHAFIVGATQDRPTKNLGLTAAAVQRLVQFERVPIKLFLTAPIHHDADWTRLPRVISDSQFNRDFVSLHDLPRTVHAALFHAATLTVHSSFYEGIIGNLPLFESLSVGTPCIFARGPHSAELLVAEPELLPFTFDPYDVPGLARLIRTTIAERDEVISRQRPIYERLRERTWAQVADGYVSAALAGNCRPV